GLACNQPFQRADVDLVREGTATSADADVSPLMVQFTDQTTLMQTQFIIVTVKNNGVSTGNRTLTLRIRDDPKLTKISTTCLHPDCRTAPPLIPATPRQVTLTIPDLPRSIAKVSGDAQSGLPNSPLAQPLVVRVTEGGAN